jgi:hypothetical protein
MRPAKIIIIILSVLLLFAAAGLYFAYSFFSAFAPAKVTITENYISTNRNFINGVTIEKIKVDSMGDEHPIKYTVTYLATCNIDHPQDRPPNPPDKIYFNKEGKYWWTEENVSIPFVHEGLSRHTTDSTQRLLGSMGTQRFATCPLRFQREQWYFFTLGDPQIVGIFFYIDKDGQLHQYTKETGISPI